MIFFYLIHATQATSQSRWMRWMRDIHCRDLTRYCRRSYDCSLVMQSQLDVYMYLKLDQIIPVLTCAAHHNIN